MIRPTQVWTKEQPFGAELADVRLGDGALSAATVAIGTDPEPYRLDYRLTATGRYVTARLVVRAQGRGWHRAPELERAAMDRCTTAGVGR